MLCPECVETYQTIVWAKVPGQGIVAALARFFNFVRYVLVGRALYAYHEYGDVHEHLTRPMGVAYLQLRVGGIFRRCRISNWQGTVLSWRVECWRGLLAPVTIRHRETGETFASCAPAQLLARTLASVKRPYERPVITPVVAPSTIESVPAAA